MNKMQLEQIRRSNLQKLDSAYRPKINSVEVDVHNSVEHELAKFLCMWLIRNGVPANQLLTIKLKDAIHGKISLDVLQLLMWKDDCGQKFKHEWERPQVVTEARFKLTQNEILNQVANTTREIVESKDKVVVTIIPAKLKQRRADIFILDTGEIVEIETGKSYKKRDKNVIEVNI